MKLHEETLPPPEELARHMGLRDLRIGRHLLRADAGSVSVTALWFAEVVPSFQPRIALAVATAQGEPGWVKAVMATADALQTVTLDADPMRQALNGADLFCGEATPAALNGIAYLLTFQTLHLHGTLQFGNPADRCLCRLETALLEVARSVARQSGNARLTSAVEGWREFVGDKPLLSRSGV